MFKRYEEFSGRPFDTAEREDAMSSLNKGGAADPNEAVLNDRAFFGHPKGVGALAFGNMCNSFAWAAVYAVLIYYLYAPYTKGLGFTEGEAATMIAAMGAGNSLFVIVGSWFADRVFGARNALVIGNLLKAAAFGLLAVPAFTLEQGRVCAVIGLVLMALPIMGASNPSLTGQMYRSDDNGRRDAAFTIHTVANAISGVIAPVLVGFIGEKNYHIGFGIGAVWALAYGAVIFFTRNKFFGTIGGEPVNPLTKEEAKKTGMAAAAVLGAGAVIIGVTVASGLLTFNGIINVLTTATFIIPIVFLIKLFNNQKISSDDRKKLVPFLKLFCAQVVVATATVMITSAIAVFLEAKVDREFLGITFAPATFTSIYNVFGLILGPVFVVLWTKSRLGKITTSKKFAAGIISYAISYGVLSIPLILGFSGKINPILPILFYLLMTMGDNMVYPIGNSITARLAPKSFETQMQSAWSQTISIANGITMVLFKFFTTADSQMTLFPIMAAVLFITGIVVFVFSKNIEKDIA